MTEYQEDLLKHFTWSIVTLIVLACVGVLVWIAW